MFLSRFRNMCAVCLIALLTVVARTRPAVAAAIDLLNDELAFSGKTLHLRPYVKLPFGNDNIISMTTRPGDTRLYVSTQQGTIFVVDDDGNGNTSPEPWFDVSAAVQIATGRKLVGFDGHDGLQSLAFHPDFVNAESAGYGKLYTTMMEERPDNPAAHHYLGDSSCCVPETESVLAEWTYNHDDGVVDPNSYRELFRVRLPVRDHMIKQARFNYYAQRDQDDYGLLYITHGDSSSQQSTEDRPLRLDHASGKMFRIDPLETETAPYSIPESNPFALSEDPDVLQEIFAYGFRNPHNFSFNPDDDGNVHILVGDIGRSNIEEVNLVVNGGDYGWTKREGTFVHEQTTINVDNPNNPPPNADAGYVLGVEDLHDDEATVGVDAQGNHYIYPVAQWDHNDNDVHIGQDYTATAIASGFVIRNGSDPDLHNQFIHHNFAFNHGDVYHNDFDDILNAVTQLDPDDPDRDEPDELTQAETFRLHLTLDDDNDPDTPALEFDDYNELLQYVGMTGFVRNDGRYGEGAFGEMYISTKDDNIRTVYLVTNTLPLFGDYNRDGVVNAADYVVWRNSQGETGYHHPADGNGDGTVDYDDYAVWVSHFGEVWSESGSGAAAGSAQASVPEPTTVLLTLGIAVALLSAGARCGARPRRKSSRIRSRSHALRGNGMCPTLCVAKQPSMADYELRRGASRQCVPTQSVGSRSKRPMFAALLLVFVTSSRLPGQLLGDLVDVSHDFENTESTFFVAGSVTEFDAEAGAGTLRWMRYKRQPSLSFNKLDTPYVRGRSTEFPGTQYDRDPELPFAISLVSPRTVRLRFSSRSAPLGAGRSLMLAADVPSDDTWNVDESDGEVNYTSAAGRVRLTKDPWRIEFYDADGRLLTRTQTLEDRHTFSAPTPFSFVRRGRDLGRSMAASLELAHDEKIFGCGESFTRLDKRGQKVVAYLRDAMGAQTPRMYKPIPFFLSSRGYGVFVHTSAPVTLDFGHDFDQSNVIYTGDETLDLFVFLGTPQEVLTEYTAITGRAPVPPLWSFGLWMSRITYESEEQVRNVAAKLRAHQIPCDVIHVDTGWFETEWQCNFQFAPSRFPDPAKMIADLRRQGFRISLWQLPYFTSKNELFAEAVDKGLFVKNEGGALPYEDGILDFSNPDAVRWYEQKLKGLLDLGVAAIKVDFGEDAPLKGVYASGRTGLYEHNLYPLRYNKLVADLTERVTGEHIIWARSAWAGSQRYPVHWGGDAENTDSAMAATLRGGLSLGLCGFTYWSHDAGGFVDRAPRDLYRRWLPFAALTSHTRCHGTPPREPWEYDEEFVEDFRAAIEMKYRLMPYIYSQAVASSERGHPLVRTLFFEFPDDPTSWLVEDEYLLGSDLLVAPLFSDTPSRPVYLPPGAWIDYQTGTSYEGGKWLDLSPAVVPCIVLARGGAAIPHAAVAQSTDRIDWSAIELRVFATDPLPAVATFAEPGGDLHTLTLAPTASGEFALQNDPLAGRVTWRISRAGDSVARGAAR